MNVEIGPQLRRVEALGYGKYSPFGTEIETGVVGESPIRWNRSLLCKVDCISTVCQSYVWRTSRVQRVTCICNDADCSERERGGQEKINHHSYALKIPVDLMIAQNCNRDVYSVEAVKKRP